MKNVLLVILIGFSINTLAQGGSTTHKSKLTNLLTKFNPLHESMKRTDGFGIVHAKEISIVSTHQTFEQLQPIST